jgi:branched-subunit amino acid transport protein
VSVELVVLALLMGLVTYPARALPLLAPGIERLPAPVIEYLRLIGPATLAALAALGALFPTDAAGHVEFHVGIEIVAVLACAAVTAWRRNLLLGMLVGVGLVALVRAVHLG